MRLGDDNWMECEWLNEAIASHQAGRVLIQQRAANDNSSVDDFNSASFCILRRPAK